jgi:hypothetical protein
MDIYKQIVETSLPLYTFVQKVIYIDVVHRLTIPLIGTANKTSFEPGTWIQMRNSCNQYTTNHRTGYTG